MRIVPLVFLLTMGALVWVGCKDEDAPTDLSTSMTADDAADAIASALGGSQATSGLTAQLEEGASVAGGGTLGKVDGTSGVLFDTTVTRQRTGTYSFSYTFQFSWNLVNINQFTFAYAMHGVYDTPRMSSDDSATATFQVSNLLTGSTYLASGIYNRYGTQASKVRNKVSFRSTFTFSTTDLQIDKATRRITSGTGTVTFYGQTSTGNIFSYTGTVVFMGNQSATLTMSGTTYTLNLALGQAG